MLLQHIPLFAAVLAVGYSLAIVLHRTLLHPASKFPGPFLNKLTGIPELIHAWRGDRHLYLYNLHLQYGPVVRYAPNKLSFNSAESLRDIYSGSKANIRKADFYNSFPALKGFPSTHSAIDKHVHSRKRRVLSHAFSTTAIASMEEYIVKNVRRFCMLLGDQTRDTVAVPGSEKPAKNVAKLANYLTFDVMGELCFGKAFGMLSRPDIRFVSNLIDSAAHRHLVCGVYELLDRLHLDKVFFYKLAQRRARYMIYSKAQAAERTARTDHSERRDFFYHLLHAKDPETGEGFQMNELWSESNLLIVAGSDTSSTALAATLRFLALNPASRKHLAEILRNRFGSVNDIKGSLSDIPYLRACIDEAMRLAPPVPGLLPRLVLTPTSIDGYLVPAGVEVGTSCYSVHHNPRHYVEADTYKPERWLNEEPLFGAESEAATARSAFCPFSVGSRACIGRGLAYFELDIAVARTVYMYDFSTVTDGEFGSGAYGIGYGPSLDLPAGSEKLRQGEKPTDFRLWDHFTAFKEGPLVRFSLVNQDETFDEEVEAIKV